MQKAKRQTYTRAGPVPNEVWQKTLDSKEMNWAETLDSKEWIVQTKTAAIEVRLKAAPQRIDGSEDATTAKGQMSSIYQGRPGAESGQAKNFGFQMQIPVALLPCSDKR